MMTFLFFFLISLACCDQLFLSSRRILAPTQQSSISNQYFNPNSSFSFTIPQSTFTSTSTITYTSNLNGGGSLPSWMNFNSATLTYSGFVPMISGVFTIQINAIDSQGITHATFNFNINNIAPSIQVNNQYSAIVNKFFVFQAVISDLNSDSLQTNLTLSDGSAVPSWLIWTNSNNSFSGISSTSQVLNLILNAYDGTSLTSKSITFSVNPILTQTENIRDSISYVTSDQYTWQVPYVAFSGYNLSYNIKSQSNVLPNWFTYLVQTLCAIILILFFIMT